MDEPDIGAENPTVAAAFVDRFAAFWQEPSPPRLAEILHEDIVLVQPMARPMHGLAAARTEFGRLWRFLPDLRADVVDWRGDEARLFIEIEFHASVGSATRRWPAVDRFALRGDRARERVSYWDPTPLLLGVGGHPPTALRWWRSGAARPWRTVAA